MTDIEMALMANIAVDMQNKEGNEVLDKIRTEIERQEKWLMDAGYNQYNVDIALDAIKSVVDKCKAETEAEDGNDD